MPGDKDILVEARRLLALDTPSPWLRISPELLKSLTDELERLRNEVKDIRSACEYYLERERQIINLLRGK